MDTLVNYGKAETNATMTTTASPLASLLVANAKTSEIRNRLAPQEVLLAYGHSGAALDIIITNAYSAMATATTAFAAHSDHDRVELYWITAEGVQRQALGRVAIVRTIIADWAIRSPAISSGSIRVSGVPDAAVIAASRVWLAGHSRDLDAESALALTDSQIAQVVDTQWPGGMAAFAAGPVVASARAGRLPDAPGFGGQRLDSAAAFAHPRSQRCSQCGISNCVCPDAQTFDHDEMLARRGTQTGEILTADFLLMPADGTRARIGFRRRDESIAAALRRHIGFPRQRPMGDLSIWCERRFSERTTYNRPASSLAAALGVQWVLSGPVAITMAGYDDADVEALSAMALESIVELSTH